MLTLNYFQEHLTPHKHFIVAYSGGVDSHVLLHVMSQIPHDSLKAVYVNHGLSSHANEWQAHCARVCASLNISFEAYSIEVIKKPRHSLEAIARDLRYELLSTLLDEETVLLTGHNQNDQAETVLLQLMRGAGVKGLSAMPKLKRLGQGWQARPLLQVTRAEIEYYARAHDLQWIEDDSNVETHFERNFLRHNIIPELQQRREGVVQNIARSGSHIAETLELMHDLAVIDYEQVKGDALNMLCIAPLKALSDARQSNVIRYWLSMQEPPVPSPSHAILMQIKQQLLYSYPGAHPAVHYQGYCLMRELGSILLTIV